MEKVMSILARRNAIIAANEILNRKPVFLDTETTGLNQFDEIIEIAILDTDGSLLYQTLIKPRSTIPIDVIKIHGIDNSMVHDAQFWPDLWPLIKTHLNNRLIASYNAEFDQRMLMQSHFKNNLDYSRENLNFSCIMKLYSQFKGEWDAAKKSFRYQKLELAIQQCGILGINTHRALDDARLACELLHFIASSPS